MNGLVYLGSSIYTGRLARELLPRRVHWRQIGATIREHLTLKLDQYAGTYNVLQRLAYLLIVFVAAPLVVLTGITLSPAVTAAAPWLLDLFGGRQSARTIHFILTGLFVLFAVVHVVMVVVSGFFNNIRAMITGWHAGGGEGSSYEKA